MNIFHHFKGIIGGIVDELTTEGVFADRVDSSRITVEVPKDVAHGDLSTNVAMVLCKQAKMRPRDLAEKIVEKLSSLDEIASVEIAGPGFINLRLSVSVWQGLVKSILELDLSYGQSTMGGMEKINVEYVSANPTGPLHVGHTRGAVVGDVLANLFDKAGYDVTREYYINDAGAQVDVLARSAHIRYREALGETVGEIPEGLYPGDYLVPTGKALAEEFGDKYKDAPEEEWLELFRNFSMNKMMDLIREDLAVLGVEHDVFTSEKGLVDDGKVQEAFDVLLKAGHIEFDTLPPPKGKEQEDWKPVELPLFKATNFGCDKDSPLKKSNGDWTYTAPDIANHWDKFRRGFGKMYDIVGVDHVGWAGPIKACTKAVTDSQGVLEVKLCGLVNLMKDGEPVKMSKRAGTFLTMRDVVDEVGRDAVRFMMMQRRNDMPIDFDFTKVTEQSKDNPVFYVQYAYARCQSILRHAAEKVDASALAKDALAGVDLSSLSSDDDISVIRILSEWPREVEAAAEAEEPHRISFYLYEVASAFHSLWNKGKSETTLRFIHDDEAVTKARLALVQSVATVIASGLAVLGIDAIDEM